MCRIPQGGIHCGPSYGLRIHVIAEGPLVPFVERFQMDDRGVECPFAGRPDAVGREPFGPNSLRMLLGRQSRNQKELTAEALRTQRNNWTQIDTDPHGSGELFAPAAWASAARCDVFSQVPRENALPSMCPIRIGTRARFSAEPGKRRLPEAAHAVGANSSPYNLVWMICVSQCSSVSHCFSARPAPRR